jgi:hypothetical protein
MPPPAPLVPNPGGGTSGGSTGTNPVCFQSEILPLFQSFCAKSGCHDAVTKKDGYVLDSYDNLFKKEGKITSGNIRGGKPESSLLYTVMFESGSDKMPPAGNLDLTIDQKNLIARWIREGAKNTTGCNTSCDSNQFKFAANIMPILQNYCNGCHSGTLPAGGVILTSYNFVQPVATSGLLYGVTAHLPGYNPMPKGSLTTIPDCEKAQIRKWVQAGAPNN